MKHWRKCVGAGRANEGMRASWREQLKDVVRYCGFEYIRFHGLLCDEMMIYREDDSGKPIFNWQYVDELFDFLLETGIRPFVEFGFMPEALKSAEMTVFWWKGNVSPPKDYDRWGELIGKCAEHWIERYGIDEVREWYFEIWNEANLNEMFFSGTQAEYFKMYEFAVKALKAVDDRLRVGGPATSSFEDGEGVWIKDFLKFCEAKNLPCDFVSTHPYPVTHPVDEKTGEILDEFRDENSTRDDLTWLKKTVEGSAFPDAEIHCTEWNSSPRPRDFTHDHPFAGTFIIRNNIETIGLCDSLSYWTFTDIFEEQRAGYTPFHGGFGLINFQGIKKPAFWAYHFLNMLGEEIIGQGDGWFATREEGRIVLLLWNYQHYDNPDARLAWNKDTIDFMLPGGKPERIDIRISGLSEGERKVMEWKIDGLASSPFHRWKKAGHPDWLTPEQVEEFGDKTLVYREYETSDGELYATLKPHCFQVVVIE